MHISNEDLKKMTKQIDMLIIQNRNLYEYKDLADQQTQQLESLANSIENLNRINRHIGNEWSKTIQKMKLAREEMDSVVKMMGKLFEENQMLKNEINRIKKN